MSDQGSHQGSSRLAATVLAFAFLLAAPAHADPSVEAIWRSQQLPFNYHSTRTAYSCSGLQERIRAILQAVGAGVVRRRRGGMPGRRAAALRARVDCDCNANEATDANILAATRFSPTSTWPHGCEASLCRLPRTSNGSRRRGGEYRCRGCNSR